MTTRDEPIELSARALRRWPLPTIAQDADKEVRGRVLVIGGSREIPGAAVLAATAALRAGAGKLVVATARSAAGQLAAALPEARVIAMEETASGALSSAGLAALEDAASSCDAAVVGPGLMDEVGSQDFIQRLLPLLARAPLVLDALAMKVMERIGRADQPLLLTPHAGEMAGLLGRHKRQVQADVGVASEAAAQWNAVVLLKGATTLLASPDGRLWRHDSGQPGLATSGSGDVLAGLIAGLAAQGAALEQAAAWGAVLHALAGARLGRRIGSVGYLARELPGEVPALMQSLRPRARLRRPGRDPRE